MLRTFSPLYFCSNWRRKGVPQIESCELITYGYNANGWLVGISNANNTAIVIYEYDAAGRRTKKTLENSTFTVYEYDDAGQMTSIAHKKDDPQQTLISRKR